MAENPYLELYVEPETGEVAVVQRATGSVWLTNPPNRAQEETIARGKSKDALGSQLLLTYFTQIGAEITLDTYNESVLHSQVEVIPKANGVRVEYTIGQEWTEDAWVPHLMTKERFEEIILSRASEEQREKLLDLYTLIWFEQAPADYQRVAVTQVDKERLLRNLTLTAAPEDLERRNAKRDLYNNLFDHIVGRSDIGRRGDITPEIMQLFTAQPLYMLGTRVSRWDRADIAAMMREIDFTPYDRAADLEYFGFPELLPNHRVFHVALEYELDGEELVVRVPIEDIVYPINAVNPEDVEAPPVTLPVYSISVLPYFGAAGREAEGYILVPDGSGALIDLNNGKTTAPIVTINVYGRDGAINRPEQMRHLVDAPLPVFGLYQGEHSFLAIIEQGDAVARIKADVAGRSTSYNIVYPEFIIMPKGTATLQTTDEFTREVTIAVPQSRTVKDDVVVRYAFLAGHDATYVGMAQYYQEYLRTLGMGTIQAEQPTRLYLDLIGAIQVKRPILGVPQTIVRPLTTYEQAEEILQALKQEGVDGLKVRYRGWLQGGLEHSYPNKVRWEAAVGSREDFTHLQAFAEANQIELYPDVTFLTVSKNSLLHGFLAFRDAGRMLDRSLAKRYQYDRATYQMVSSDYRYILSPKRLDQLVDRFFSDFADLNLRTVSLGDLGSELNSDFRYNPADLIDREQAKTIINSQFEKLDSYRLMVDQGFAYTLPYVSHVLNIPSQDNGYRLVDRSIPFFQMVLRGFVDYAGEPINFAHDPVTNLLKTIEGGALPYFVWSWAPSTAVKQTDYDYLHALHYGDWFKMAVDLYHELEELYALIEGQRIVDHTFLADDFTATTYENGVTVLVNYSQAEQVHGGVSVPPQSYAVLERGN